MKETRLIFPERLVSHFATLGLREVTRVLQLLFDGKKIAGGWRLDGSVVPGSELIQ